MSHPEGLPDLFVDRSLGRIQVPGLLRASGLRRVTLAERYGVPRDETIADVEWIADAGRRGEVALMKDERVRYRVAEKDAIRNHGLRCFCLTRQDLRAADMAALILEHLPSIVDACARPGPFLYVVHGRGIRRVDL